MSTLLEQVAAVIPVDCETLDLAFIRSLPITIVDCAANPVFLYAALSTPANRDIVDAVVAENPGKSFEEIYTTAIGRIHARILPHISGKVVAHSWFSTYHDVDKILACAKSFMNGWRAAGVPEDRVVLKVVTNSSGVTAAASLSKEGFPISCNNVFSIPQAVAAQQAGAESIHLYFNDPHATLAPEPWTDVANPTVDHIMAPRHLRIRQIYDRLASEGKKVPLIKTSAFRSAREVTAAVALGADHVTVVQPFLEDMAQGPGLPVYRPGQWHVPVSVQMQEPWWSGWEEWKPVERSTSLSQLAHVADHDPLTTDDPTDWMTSYTSIDWLAPGVLDNYLETDLTMKSWLGIKYGQFELREELSRNFIAEVQGQAK